MSRPVRSALLGTVLTAALLGGCGVLRTDQCLAAYEAYSGASEALDERDMAAALTARRRWCPWPWQW